METNLPITDNFAINQCASAVYSAFLVTRLVLQNYIVNTLVYFSFLSYTLKITLRKIFLRIGNSAFTLVNNNLKNNDHEGHLFVPTIFLLEEATVSFMTLFFFVVFRTIFQKSRGFVIRVSLSKV